MTDSDVPPVVRVEHLTKFYGARRAVDDVSFDMQPGEVMGLLGPNGSGKSTILRILTGYLQPTSGRAQVCGFDVVTQSLQARRCVGYVPEDVPLYVQMRVHEFLTFMGRLRGLEGAACARAIDEVVERLSFGPYRHQLIGKLSRGYRQRVAIAQALLGQPKLLILALASDMAVLVTSHILIEVERVAHRVAILLDGRLLAVQALAESRMGLEELFLALTEGEKQ